LGRTKAKIAEIAQREARILGEQLGKAADELTRTGTSRRTASHSLGSPESRADMPQVDGPSR
jgi:hypothetical protein